MINIASWNIRGLNSPLKQNEIKLFILDKEINIIDILEVKVRLQNFQNIKNKIFRNWDVLHNTSPNSVARIWLGWDPTLFLVQPLYEEEQCITCRIIAKTQDPVSFILSAVYGSNARSQRRDLWRSLRYQHTIIGQEIWLIMGDFNIILDSSGKKRNKGIDKNGIKEFKDWMNLFHIPSRGFEFSWSNKREASNRVYTKIDHMFCNEGWNNAFRDYQLDYEAPILSDHSQGLCQSGLPKTLDPNPLNSLKAG